LSTLGMDASFVPRRLPDGLLTGTASFVPRQTGSGPSMQSAAPAGQDPDKAGQCPRRARQSGRLVADCPRERQDGEIVAP